MKKLKLAATLLILSHCFVSCKHPEPPPWHGKIYAGNSEKGAIIRKQSNEEIACVDSRFNNYMCLSYLDFKELIKIIDSCEAWGKDVEHYRNKLKACGLLNNHNINLVKDCLSEKGSDF